MAKRVPSTRVAEKFGGDEQAIRRHWRYHVDAERKVALGEGREVSGFDAERLIKERSERLHENLVYYAKKMNRAIDNLEAGGDYTTAVKYWQHLLKAWELEAKYLGELQQYSQTVNLNILSHPTYVEMRSKLIEALGRFPEARRHVARELEAVENEHARVVDAEFKEAAGADDP